MNKIFVDGNQDVLQEDSKPTPLSQVFDEIEQLCEEKNREINSVKINGKLIPPEEINLWMDKTLDDISKIEIETVSNDEISLEQLLLASSYVVEIEELVNNFIEEGKMDYQEAVLAVVSAMNKWEDVCRLIDSAAKQLNIDYSKAKFSGTHFIQQHKTSMEVINELSKAMSDKDIVSIRDILEYKFVPQIKTYQELVKAIAKEYENGLGE